MLHRAAVTLTLLAGLVTTGVAGQAQQPAVPTNPFPVPSGRYQVGTRDYEWTDPSRPERYTKDPSDHRTVLVQIWYPADPAPGSAPTPYLLHPGTVADTQVARVGRTIHAHAVVDAPLARSQPRWPVLLYDHGGAWSRWSATFTTEELASHGYVVVSVEHPGFSQTGGFLDGRRFAADTLGFPAATQDLATDARASWTYLDEVVFPIWVADARFALDRLAELDRQPGPWEGRLALDRVGAFGWSFGGATAVELSRVDPRVAVAADQDGQLFGEAKTAGTGRPVLLMHHGLDDAMDMPEAQRPVMRRLMAEARADDSTARVHSTGPWSELTIAKTQHGHFSDLLLFYPHSPSQLDPATAHTIINAYTLAFFDRYLKNRPSDLLTPGHEPFPDATVKVWRP
jgi:predicted dienelactone hydrolase